MNPFALIAFFLFALAHLAPLEICGGVLDVKCKNELHFCHFEAVDNCGLKYTTGRCVEIPEFCTEEYNPVCGCDNKTYPNECFAHMHGVSISGLGECEELVVSIQETCGGFMGRICEGEDLFCRYDLSSNCGASDMTGTCEKKPQVCTEDYTPVCGCDGVTYSNECSAHMNCISVSKLGKCEQYCDTKGTKDCPSGQFCSHPDDDYCGRFDRAGICVNIPTQCTKELKPVCGCDGVTYDNKCIANLHGTSVSSFGSCELHQIPCGARWGDSCNSDQYCNFVNPKLVLTEVSAKCGENNIAGTCATRPTICTKEYMPVCGCDNQTYSNKCMAHAAGTDVRSYGSCPEKSNICGTRGAQLCNSDQFCNFPIDAHCGETDIPGFCLTPPHSVKGECSSEHKPICGCDNVTYKNSCYASVNRTSVRYLGRCQEK